MTFESALRQFMHEIEAEYGVHDGIVRIAITPKLFDAVVYKSFLDSPWIIRSHSPSGMNDVQMFGVELVARTKEHYK